MSRYTILTALMTVLLINSCNEVDYELFPDGYVKILSIKGSGIKDCMAGNTVTEYRDSILILKGGGDPDTDAFASLQVMDMQTDILYMIHGFALVAKRIMKLIMKNMIIARIVVRRLIGVKKNDRTRRIHENCLLGVLSDVR